ncbi:RDD family protein [Microbacterium esteraromaticum]|uniref:RDD family protein n=1 Tax=Microbacterium esteraromaticum TaxID=57043 RepID=A0A939IV53_9MICO|nr:RDD family protein [Microbacterium esteraromaticum]MBN8205719.1 RDD family protein [Microbacterium esteraromaticum]MBN8415873.1 RDD family protein [Microbacterium esteraromaticum]MBN8423788.1 RDD family protein [Microbacterium esteraromaticum]
MSAEIADEQEILSGEAVAIDVQPVGFVLRAAGALIDMLFGFAVFTGFILVQVWLLTLGVLDEHTARILSIWAAVVSFLVLPITVEMATRGRSLGKLAVGGRIVRIDGGAITFRHTFIRALLGVLEIYITVGGIAVITGALTARSQRLGDLVAGTYSQRVRTPHLVQQEPVLPPSLTGWATVADVARMPDRLARRISQFLVNADRLSPAARLSVGRELAAEAAPFISPVPDAGPEEMLRAVTVLRRERERRALTLSDDRAEHLSRTRIRV